MASVVAICNAALDLLGADPITALDSANAASRLCSRNYEPIRDAVLRAYPWNAATRRASLPALVTAPAWGFERQFGLPEGPDPLYCLRVLAIEDEVDYGLRYKIEGRRILTDEPAPLRVLYIGRLEDPGDIDVLLADAIAARLAVTLAANLAKSGPLVQSMQEHYRAVLAEARAVDAQEGSADRIVADDWLASRL